jgi:N-acetylmuramoyl-L-alanine amidase
MLVRGITGRKPWARHIPRAALMVVLAASMLTPMEGAGATTGASAVRVQSLAMPGASAEKPTIVWDPIPYGARRRSQMAGYAERHYGSHTARLVRPRQIVLHFSVSSTYGSVWNHFASNTPARGTTGGPERPGTCTHFVVDREGTIHQLVPLKYMCRHAVGLNDQSIGIEFVERRSAANVLRRRAQVEAGLRLVRWLQAEYRIGDADVIGHSMANRSRFFTDRQGWRNTHVDWSPAQTRSFRARL